MPPNEQKIKTQSPTDGKGLSGTLCLLTFLSPAQASEDEEEDELGGRRLFSGTHSHPMCPSTLVFFPSGEKNLFFSGEMTDRQGVQAANEGETRPP